jgi:hypothetical protein
MREVKSVLRRRNDDHIVRHFLFVVAQLYNQLRETLDSDFQVIQTAVTGDGNGALQGEVQQQHVGLFLENHQYVHVSVLHDGMLKLLKERIVGRELKFMLALGQRTEFDDKLPFSSRHGFLKLRGDKITLFSLKTQF